LELIVADDSAPEAHRAIARSTPALCFISCRSLHNASGSVGAGHDLERPGKPEHHTARTLKDRAGFLVCMTIVGVGILLLHLYRPMGADLAMLGLFILAILAAEVAGRWPSG